MTTSGPRRGLRNLMIAYFVPMAVLPLAIMAGAAIYLLNSGFNEQIAQRAKPELSTFSRNLEHMQSLLLRDIERLQKNEDIRLGILSGDRDVLEAFFAKSFRASLFDDLSLHSPNGRLRKTLSADPLDAWRKELEAFSSDSAEDRTPSNQAQSEDSYSGAVFSSRNRVSSGLVAHLRRHSTWQHLSVVDGVPALHYFALLRSKTGQHIGVLQGKAKLDAKKLKIFSRVQNVELVLLDGQLDVLNSSNVNLTNFFRKNKETYQASLSRWWNTTFSETPFAFFFSKLNVASSNDELWISVGLSKEGLASLEEQLLIVLGVLGLIMASVCIFAVVAVSNRVTKPISELVDAVEGMKRGEWVEPVSVESGTEMSFLVKRFNDMANSVQATKRMLENNLEELAKTHDDLKETQSQLVQSAKMSSLGQLVAGVAHELNNPIAFIYSNMTQMKDYVASVKQLDDALKEAKSKEDLKSLEKTLEEIDWEFMKEDMDDIVQSCLEGSIRVKDIVLGLRNFSRADRDQFEECDINHVLRETAKLLRGQLKNKVTLHWDLCPDALIKANVSQMNQVFMNLVANAAQAIEKEGNIHLHTEDLGESLRIRVRDDGKGIPQDKIAKIFDPFFTTKKVGEGTGLGLSIVYGIIQGHGGAIEVKSVTEDSDDQGSEFVITLSRQAKVDDKPTSRAS